MRPTINKGLGLITILLLILGAVSCNKFLDVTPEDRFLQGDVFADEMSINKALNGVYLNMATPSLYGEQLSMGTIDLMAQYYNPKGLPPVWKDQLAVYDYSQQDVLNIFSDIWRSAYLAVLNTNSFLANVENPQKVMADDRKDLLKGEAYGLRAFIHFDLLRLFGPVYPKESDMAAIPYLSNPTEKIQPIITAKEVIDKVLEDLEQAEKLLKNDPIRSEGIVPTNGTDPLADFWKLRNRRMNYYAVLALKARVLLYKGDKAAALATATKTIKEASKWFLWTPEAKTQPGISNPDRVFSSEVLFGLQNKEMYNSYKSLFTKELDERIILTPLPERLEQVFENNQNDYRYRVNWGSGAAVDKDYKIFIKYQDIENEALLYRALQPLIRISELYYIAAESTIDQNTALSYINTVRKNRGLGELPVGTVVKDALQNEYRKEFWGEGQTFFYYKRNALTLIPGRAYSDMPMDRSKYVVPLPRTETDNR